MHLKRAVQNLMKAEDNIDGQTHAEVARQASVAVRQPHRKLCRCQGRDLLCEVCDGTQHFLLHVSLQISPFSMHSLTCGGQLRRSGLSSIFKRFAQHVSVEV